MTTSCPHGLPSPTSCTDCMFDGPVAHHVPEAAPVPVATFRAKYDGHCPACNLPISVGQVVHKLTDDRYVHQGCEP